MTMQSPRTLFRSLAIVAIIASVLWAKADAQKYTSCCTQVSNEKVTEPVIGFELQYPQNHCVAAVILKTEKHKFCCPVRAPWVRAKIEEFMRRNLRQEKTTKPSTLSRLVTASQPV
ncbi:hypothetical protein ACEWY4_019042 [Coilia grayii]|uniref:Chemokine interleukin-8-like domain-containing protein n=1 Tax=Coilia grayii TaxID=363190 RepID=A0ABD1JFA0_9TELE